MEGGPPGGK